jgi:MFS family permease
LNTILSGRKAVLPSTLSAAIRRAVIFQVGIVAGFETIFVLGALSAQKLTGTDQLFGLSTTTAFALGQLLVSLPAGRWMDRFGRKPILVTGALGEAGALMFIGLVLLGRWPGLFLFGLFMLGLGSGAAQLVYLIGGDLYPPDRKAEGLGLMTTFASMGVIGGTYLVGFVGDAAEWIDLDPVITPWFFASIVVASVALVMAGMQPEPLEVARNPGIYFGNNNIPVNPTERSKDKSIRSLRELLRIYPIAASIGITVCFQGVRMSIVPLLTYILRARGYSLLLGATMVAAMGFGMILVSYGVGRFGDRWGRKKPLIIAAAVGLVCAVAIPLLESLPLMFAALMIMGGAFVTVLNMTRAILTDVTRPQERGTVMAMSMVAVGLAVITFPTLASYILANWGWSLISLLGACLMILVFILLSFLRENGIGKWQHRGVE